MKEALIRDFLYFVAEQNDVHLQQTEKANHSSNDFLRDLTNEETEELISKFLTNHTII